MGCESAEFTDVKKKYRFSVQTISDISESPACE